MYHDYCTGNDRALVASQNSVDFCQKSAPEWLNAAKPLGCREVISERFLFQLS